MTHQPLFCRSPLATLTAAALALGCLKSVQAAESAMPVVASFSILGDLVSQVGGDKVKVDVLVVGSGAIGIEFASFYRALGSEVTVVEVKPFTA